ncbi:MAG: hypothetical protein HYY16_01435 [Planctomycetes bacterium]|nr:hypothetical protein [Planctomycetota bacterium]
MADFGAERMPSSGAPDEGLFAQYDRQALEAGTSWWLAGALLRTPGPILREVGSQRHLSRYLLGLLAVSLTSCALYGAILGLFDHAFWAVLKVPLIVVGSALLCTPTLYIFNALSRSRLSYSQTVALVLAMTAVLSMILVAFAPIVWFFGVSTEAFGFMTLLHLGVFAMAVGFGLRMLDTARRYLAYLAGSHVIGGRLLFCWSVLVVVMGLQMAHYLRPLLLAGPFLRGQRGLFVEFLQAMMR